MNLKALNTAILPAIMMISFNAHAVCALPVADYGGGSYGAEAVTPVGGCTGTVQGGAGITSVSDSSQGMSASANLATGVLTAYSNLMAPTSSSMWDTLTFSGLPSSGGQITETLNVTGSMTNAAAGFIYLSAGTGVGGDISSLASTTPSVDSSTAFPTSFSVSFTAQNGVPVLVYAALDTSPVNGVADLLDPPTFSLQTPQGVSYTSASGVFTNVQAVPEPSTIAFLGLSAITLGVARRSKT